MDSSSRQPANSSSASKVVVVSRRRGGTLLSPDDATVGLDSSNKQPATYSTPGAVVVSGRRGTLPSSCNALSGVDSCREPPRATSSTAVVTSRRRRTLPCEDNNAAACHMSRLKLSPGPPTRTREAGKRMEISGVKQREKTKEEGGKELEEFVKRKGVRVVAADMEEAMQVHAVVCARKTHDSLEKFAAKSLALALKKEFDGAYGPAWQCVVGKSFGSFVTHSVGGFVYFCMDKKLYVLLFKTAVLRADSD